MSLPDIFTSIRQDEAEKLVELAAGKTVLEIGSWLGYSAVAMAATATVVHAVDWHQGDDQAGHENTLPGMWANVKNFGVSGKVVIHVGRADQVLPLFNFDTFDFVFIDAYHTYDAVMADIALVIPLLKDDGVIAFHDYGDERFGVTKAVDKVFGVPAEVVNTLAIIR